MSLHQTALLFLMGPPGSGKGTQAKLLARAHEDYQHVSTGDLFRSEVSSGSELGKSVEETLKQGQLVSDHITNRVFHSQIQELKKKYDQAKVFMLDGYPRTATQAEFLRDLVREDSHFYPLHIIELDVPEDLLVQRISGRLVNPRLGIVYHKETQPPKVEGVCDQDGGPLIQRDDDQEETIRERYQIYRKEVDGIVTLLGGHDRVVKVDGTLGPQEVFKNLEEAIAGLKS